MPDLGTFGAVHPIVAHFTIALLLAGVIFRLVSLTGRLAFTGPAALTLLLVGTTASVISVKSGEDAHRPVEQVPGSREAVEEHEDWGKWTRNVFLGVAVLELGALALARRGKARPLQIASGLLGVAGAFCLFEAAEHGGDLVYAHAGGVGLRRRDPQDVERLLLAGLFHQARVERQAGRLESAAALLDMAAGRHPNDLEVQLVAAESRLIDRKDPAAALAHLARLQVPKEPNRLRLRHGLLTADALVAAGQVDGAKATLQGLRAAYPSNEALDRKLKELGGS